MELITDQPKKRKLNELNEEKNEKEVYINNLKG